MSESDAMAVKAKHALVHLAIGLLRQHGAIERGTANPVTVLDDQLQLGWDKLACLCLENGASPPRHLADLVEWLHKPVEDWIGVGELFRDSDIAGPLLYCGVPGELCDDLVGDLELDRDPERELQDTPFKEILAYCKAENLPDQYTRARLLLLTNPYLPYGAVISADAQFDDMVRRWLIKAYEPVPMVCRRQIDGKEKVAFCPRCGWPLEWRTQDKKQASCYGELCSRLVPGLHTPQEWVDCPPEAMRTTRGIQSSVVGPELALWEMCGDLESMGMEYTLWPEIDNYDLYIEVPPDGERWAVDVKDVANPRSLAAQVGHFRNTPPWDRAFYVFPDHRRSADYMRVFRTYWARPQHTDAVFAGDMLRSIRERKEDQNA